MATASTMARSTMAPASPTCSSRRALFARGPRHRALDRLPVGDGRGKGPARQRILCRQPALSAGQDGRRAQHRFDGRLRPGARLQHFGHGAARPARCAGRRRDASRAALSRPNPIPRAGGFYRSDHFPMAKVGVPAISFKSGQIWSMAGSRAARRCRRTIPKRYHQPDDEYSPSWDFSGIVADGTASRGRARPRQFDRLAQLERGQRVPGGARSQRGRARWRRRRPQSRCGRARRRTRLMRGRRERAYGRGTGILHQSDVARTDRPLDARGGRRAVRDPHPRL